MKLGTPVARIPFMLGLAAMLGGLLTVWSAGSLGQPAGQPEPKAPKPAAPAAAPPVAAPADKIQSPEDATARMKELVTELGQADDGKLDFDKAKAVFEKLAAVKPFAEKLDEHVRPHYYLGVASVGLLAGEPDAAVEALKAIMDSKDIHIDEKGVEALSGKTYFAAFVAGDEKTAKQMLAKMDMGQAKEASKYSDVVGKKVPAFSVPLMDGKTTFRSTGAEDNVVVFCTWALLANDAHKQVLAQIKTLQDRYKNYPAVTVICVNMDDAAGRALVVGALNASGLGGLHVFEGKGHDGPMVTSLGLASIIGALVIAPDHRVLYKGGAGDIQTTWAINAGLKQIEKRHAKAKADPVRPGSPTSRPAAVTNPPPVSAPPARPAQVDNAQDLLNLAETYRSGGMKDKATELLNQVIKDFPDSPQAKTARALLEK